MRRLKDFIQLIVARWRAAPKLVTLTVINLAVAMCILDVFANAGLNINTYINQTFLSAESMREVLVTSKTAGDLTPQSQLLADPTVSTWRGICAADVPVSDVQGTANQGEPPTVTIMDASDMVFPGQDLGGGPEFSKVTTSSDWRGGVVISQTYLTKFNGADPLGRIVSFTYQSVAYRLPITAVIAFTAEAGYDTTYQADMYVLAQNLKTPPTRYAMVDVQIKQLNMVRTFVNRPDLQGLLVLSNLDDVEQSLAMSRAIAFILLLIGLALLCLTAVGLVNSLTFLQEQDVRHVALLQLLGFSSRSLTLMTLLESALMGVLGYIVGGGAFLGLMGIAQLANPGHLGTVSTAILANVNITLVWASLVASVVVVMVCKLLAARRVGRFDFLPLLKAER